MARPLANQYKRKGSYIRKWADEFQLIYRPGRNGHLSISTRRAVELLRVSENTVKNAFYELVEHGFLALSKGEVLAQRMAREWRLTIEPCNGREPTDDWRNWEPGKPVATIFRKKTWDQKRGQNCPNNGDRLPQKQGQDTNTDQIASNATSTIQ